jgi:hypothetical protein
METELKTEKDEIQQALLMHNAALPRPSNNDNESTCNFSQSVRLHVTQILNFVECMEIVGEGGASAWGGGGSAATTLKFRKEGGGESERGEAIGEIIAQTRNASIQNVVWNKKNCVCVCVCVWGGGGG